MAFVIQTLTAKPFLLGDDFSAADVLFGSTFALFANHPLLPKSPVLDAYVKRCGGRPAYAPAAARDHG